MSRVWNTISIRLSRRCPLGECLVFGFSGIPHIHIYYMGKMIIRCNDFYEYSRLVLLCGLIFLATMYIFHIFLRAMESDLNI